MEKAEQHFQWEYIRNAPILLDWNDIRNADMNELYDIAVNKYKKGEME